MRKNLDAVIISSSHTCFIIMIIIRTNTIEITSIINRIKCQHIRPKKILHSVKKKKKNSHVYIRKMFDLIIVAEFIFNLKK